MDKRRQVKLGAGSPDDLASFTKEFTGDSERAAAIVAQAAVEERVRMALYCAMGLEIEQARIAKEITGDDDTLGVLTFSYQIKLAYCLGAISANGLRDMGIMAKIRNKFAHTSGHKSFDKDPVKSMCVELKAANECTSSEGPLTMRERYLMSGVVIGMRMDKWMTARLDNRDKNIGKATRSSPAKPARRKKRQ